MYLKVKKRFRWDNDLGPTSLMHREILAKIFKRELKKQVLA